VVNHAAWWGIAAVLASVAAIALAYQGLRSEMTAQYATLQEQLGAIRTELREIRDFLDADDQSGDAEEEGATPTFDTVHFNLSGYPVLGNPRASLVMVEFTDFQCPFCVRYHAITFPHLKQAYVDTQRLRYISVDFPLDFHELAFKAAEAAHCGGEQGHYWPVYDRLFQAAPRIDTTNVIRVAQSLGLNASRFRQCLESGAMETKVRRGIAQGLSLGIDSTPTFILGRAEGSVVRGRLIVGAYPTHVFDALIRAHLALK
jgi:protein-disulfide isomerase